LERLLHDSFAWRRCLLTSGDEVDGLPYPLHWPTAHNRLLRGTRPTCKTSFSLVVVMVDGVYRGKGSFPGRHYLMEDLSSLVPTYGMLHIVNDFQPGGAHPLAAL
jgi:hypothetical protein